MKETHIWEFGNGDPYLGVPGMKETHIWEFGNGDPYLGVPGMKILLIILTSESSSDHAALPQQML
jgi:hypothetical protein